MAVASKSHISDRKRQALSTRVVAINPKGKSLEMSAKDLTTRPKPSGKNIPVLVSSRSTPPWWLRLCCCQRYSSVVTLLLVVSTLTVYAWTAYSQQVWSREYRKLTTLQRDERQLTTTNEVLKNKMAQQGEDKAAALEPLNPATTIFLPSLPQHPVAASISKPSAQKPQQNLLPLGY